MTERSSAGLLAAAFTAIVPSYISRSVGGSHDNEGVAIFALIFVSYLWIKSVNTGSMMWACLTVRERGPWKVNARSCVEQFCRNSCHHVTLEWAIQVLNLVAWDTAVSVNRIM